MDQKNGLSRRTWKPRLKNSEFGLQASDMGSINTSAFMVGTNPTGELITSGFPAIQAQSQRRPRQTKSPISGPLGQIGLCAQVVHRLVCSQLVYPQT
jgi:hypothetical protein